MAWQGKARRGKAPWLLAAGVTAAVVLGAAAPAAWAGASANIRHSPGTSAAFTLAGTNGYSLYFKSEKGQLTITASQQRPVQPTIAADGTLVPARLGSSVESTYVVSGVDKDPATITADLGPAGHVSLAFEPSGKKKVTSVDFSGKTEKCIGAVKVTRRLGNFVGTVSFHGENGYTTAEAASVPGTVGTSPVRNCSHLPKHPPAEERLPERPTFLTVSGDASLLAIRDSAHARFIALGGEELGDGVFVLRSATVVAAPGLFSFAPNGRRASVHPPAPFSGVGLYRDPSNGPPTWSGDLTVAFPGVQQPLAGEGDLEPTLKLGTRRGA